MFKKITTDTKVKLLQAAVYAIVAYTLIYHWQWDLFLLALGAGWVLWLAGVYASLHRYSSHKCFTPKNNVVKFLLLLAGTLTSLGSNISWAAVHRKHHQYSDQPGDPHSIHNNGGGFWNGLKIYFYYFPTYLVSPRLIKDLTNDRMHRWFHRNYFLVIAVYAMALALINPVYVGYFYALPALYCFTGISYITVTAHCTWIGKLIGYRNFEITDHTFNWRFGNWILPGEGNHNNHHAQPGAARGDFSDRDIDTGMWFLNLVGNMSSKQEYYNKLPRIK